MPSEQYGMSENAGSARELHLRVYNLDELHTLNPPGGLPGVSYPSLLGHVARTVLGLG